MVLRRGALLFLKVINQISRSHGSKNCRFWPKLGVSGLYLQFEFTNGYEMMHKARSSIEEVPYCFSRSYVKFQGHTGQKIVDFDLNWGFPDCNSSLNSHRLKNWRFESNLSKITRPVAAIKSLRFALFTMFPSSYHHEIFRSYYQWQKWRPCKRSRSEVTTQLKRFRTVTPVWIHIWWWNDAYSLIMLRKGAILFLKVISQISRSYGSKKRRIWPRLGVSRL